MQKQQARADELEISQLQAVKQKQNLRRQLEKRSIEQGVATKNMQDVEAKLIFEDGSRARELKNEKKSGVPIMEVVDLQ